MDSSAETGAGLPIGQLHVQTFTAYLFGVQQNLTGDEIFQLTSGEFGDFGDAQLYSPAIGVLPMGFSWSFYLVQCIHEQSVCRSSKCSRDQLVLEGSPPPSLEQDSVLSMPYCDNAHVISLSEDRCKEGVDAAKLDLEQLGFQIHEEEDANTYFRTLGGMVDGKLGQVRATDERVWNLIAAFRHIATHIVSPEVVQRLLGHAMVVCAINRYGVCIFRHLYDYAQSSTRGRFLNKQERRECFLFAGIVPMLFSSLRRPWSDVVTCTDASPDGYGICQTTLPNETVNNIGRWQERWRYKRLPPSEWAPRRRALGLDVFAGG